MTFAPLVTRPLVRGDRRPSVRCSPPPLLPLRPLLLLLLLPPSFRFTGTLLSFR